MYLSMCEPKYSEEVKHHPQTLPVYYAYMLLPITNNMQGTL